MSGRSGFVYVIQDGTDLCKIGRARDVQQRLRALACRTLEADALR